MWQYQKLYEYIIPKSILFESHSFLRDVWGLFFVFHKTIDFLSIYRYIDKFMSIFQKHVNISINLCQDFRQCQCFDKLTSIFLQKLIFRQIYVNISKSCEYFAKSAQKGGLCPDSGESIFPSAPSPGNLVIYRYIHTRIFGPRFVRPQF